MFFMENFDYNIFTASVHELHWWHKYDVLWPLVYYINSFLHCKMWGSHCCCDIFKSPAMLHSVAGKQFLTFWRTVVYSPSRSSRSRMLLDPMIKELWSNEAPGTKCQWHSTHRVTVHLRHEKRTFPTCQTYIRGLISKRVG